MTTIQVHDKITPALQQMEHRLTNRRLILRMVTPDHRKLTVQKPATHAVRVSALFRNKPTTIPLARARYVLVGGQVIQAGQRRLPSSPSQERYILVNGVKYPAAATRPRLHPTVLRQARQAATEFVRAEIEAALDAT